MITHGSVPAKGEVLQGCYKRGETIKGEHTGVLLDQSQSGEPSKHSSLPTLLAAQSLGLSASNHGPFQGLKHAYLLLVMINNALEAA